MTTQYPRAKKLRPTGHSATIEALIQPAIVVGSTLMSAISAYVLALDEITHLLNRHGSPSDVFVVTLCGGMGFLIDMAIIVSATRYKMHAVRADPREDRWRQLAKIVLIVGLTSEAMTLLYFFVHLDPAAFPPFLIWLATIIHAVLAAVRGILPPVVIAYFAAGVLPVTFDRADRNREIKSRTSSNVMLLIDRLSQVMDTDDKAEMLRALGGQLMLDTYATYDETARTTEDQQLRRDAKLLAHLARIHRLDWSAIAADVAPELAGAPTGRPEGKRKEEEQEGEEQRQEREREREGQEQPQPIPLRQPQRQPPERPAQSPALAPAASSAVRTSARAASGPAGRNRRTLARATARAVDASESPAAMPAAVEAEEGSAPGRLTLRQRREEAARRVLADDPDITNAKLAQRIAIATKNRIGETTARATREQLEQQLEVERQEQAAARQTIQRPPLHIITPTLAPTTAPTLAPAREQREN